MGGEFGAPTMAVSGGIEDWSAGMDIGRLHFPQVPVRPAHCSGMFRIWRQLGHCTCIMVLTSQVRQAARLGHGLVPLDHPVFRAVKTAPKVFFWDKRNALHLIAAHLGESPYAQMRRRD